jgi:hypothetical protein
VVPEDDLGFRDAAPVLVAVLAIFALCAVGTGFLMGALLI